jgi:simple sugar transport system ATP-binding protein
VRGILDAGVGFVPEDRNEDGLIAEFTIAENLMLNRAEGLPFVKAGNLQLSVLAEFAEEKIVEFDIRAQGIGTHASNLSGGNQQKLVLARELSRELRLLVAAQPTRGLDVGSVEFVHTRIVETRDAGIPVLVVSTELDEVAALADRIVVMYRGGIVGIVPGDTPREVLGLMMAGEAPAGTGKAA